MRAADISLLIIAVSLRAVLPFTSFAQYLQSRPELASPLTAFYRICEADHLLSEGVSPYVGWAVHAPPLLLFTAGPLCRVSAVFRATAFLLIDVIAAFILFLLVRRYSKLADSNEKLQMSPMYFVFVYLLNPLNIAACIGQSLGGLHNALLLSSLLFAVRGHVALSTFFLAVSAYLTLHPLLLLAPLALFMRQMYGIKVFISVFLFMAWAAALLGASFLAFHSWEFAYSTYWFTLTASDLTPNMGMWWYFFTEMFAQFRPFFCFAFQYLFLFHCGGIMIRFRKQPLFVAVMFLVILALFKPYPTISDTSLYLTLLLLVPHILQRLRYSFLVANGFIYPLILAPLLWRHWVDLGSGNANFYWATCFVFALVQVWLVVDLLYAGRSFEHSVKTQQREKVKQQ